MSNLNYYLRMNAFFKFIGAHDEKISKVELSVIACIAICACFLCHWKTKNRVLLCFL